MTALGVSPRGYRAFKALLFALLAGNTAFFLWQGTLGEALDAGAWLVLLALFEIETVGAQRARGRFTAPAIRAARLAAAGVICAAVAAYWQQNDRLDVLNSVLWIAVVALLECEIRYPRFFARWRRAFTTCAGALYLALAALVVVWTVRGEWFDAYDAFLWLTAFALIEMDILRVAADKAP